MKNENNPLVEPKNLRPRLKLINLSELARSSGVRRNRIRDFARGKYDKLRIEDVKKIERVIGKEVCQTEWSGAIDMRVPEGKAIK